MVRAILFDMGGTLDGDGQHWLDRFVDGNGAVVNFNHDNREIRADFIQAGLVAPYSATTHPATIYKRIVREWTDFAY